ncbi:hypothetical protein KBD71_03655 [Candidatus Woesebacteria bacterium]|nr:hypothetical protein [Candidatus Woesebacteria bacterium]
MKKAFLVLSIVCITGFAFAGCRKKTAEPQAVAPTPKPRKVDKDVNKEPLENRPFVRLSPRQDGKAIDFTIVEVKKQAADLEYEIEYSAGELIQGAFGTVDSLSSLPLKKEILLGSCSSGGKCTYNTNVSGGNLSLRFGNPDYNLKSEWSYKEKAMKEKVFSSRDAKFTLDVSKAKSTADYIIVHAAPGYPGKIEKTIVAGPYIIAPAEQIKGNVTVTVRLPLDQDSGTILAWDGTAWKEWQTKTTDRVSTATGPMAEVFVVVKK